MKNGRLRLGVNIDHVATIRNARGGGHPDPVRAANLAAEAGADGITAHLREDRRHISDDDITRLMSEISQPLNLEMAVTEEMLEIGLKHLPNACCLVPEKREELTTEGGLDAAGQIESLRATVDSCGETGISVSLFIGAEEEQIKAAAALGVPYIELHTGTYCELPSRDRDAELRKLVAGAQLAHELGIKVNAGHGINLDNIGEILKVPHMDTLNIGHSIVARSVYVGLAEATREMLQAMAAYRGGEERT